jgi:hypothetical protein
VGIPHGEKRINSHGGIGNGLKEEVAEKTRNLREIACQAERRNFAKFSLP